MSARSEARRLRRAGLAASPDLEALERRVRLLELSQAPEGLRGRCEVLEARVADQERLLSSTVEILAHQRRINQGNGETLDSLLTSVESLTRSIKALASVTSLLRPIGSPGGGFRYSDPLTDDEETQG